MYDCLVTLYTETNDWSPRLASSYNEPVQKSKKRNQEKEEDEEEKWQENQTKEILSLQEKKKKSVEKDADGDLPTRW